MEDPVITNYSVYCHTSPEGKKYIGLTCQKPAKRFGINGSRYKRNQHLSAAIEKYGWDNFAHEILFDGLTKYEAISKEIELIAQYKTTDRRYGYNHSLGGEGSLGVRMPEHVKELLRKINTGGHISEEHKDRIRKANTGKVLSEETKEKIREANRGKTLSAKTRSKIGESSKGNAYRAVRVRCVETGEVFDSVLSAAKHVGTPSSNICRSCYKGGTAKGFHWEHIEGRKGNDCSCRQVEA